MTLIGSREAWPAGHEWCDGPQHPRWESDEIHVWSVRLPETAAATLHGLLTADEQARATHLRFAEDRARFIGARAALRLLLSRYLDVAAEKLRFATGAAGKPHLDLPGSLMAARVRFNLAHSGGLALYAVAVEREVGIDVERLREAFDWQGISRRFFAPPEHAALQALAPKRQLAAFFDCWVRKEAYVKAHGRGLSLGLGSFAVPVHRVAQPTRVDAAAADAQDWWVQDVPVETGYAAALAGQGLPPRVRYWRLQLS